MAAKSDCGEHLNLDRKYRCGQIIVRRRTMTTKKSNITTSFMTSVPYCTVFMCPSKIASILLLYLLMSYLCHVSIKNTPILAITSGLKGFLAPCHQIDFFTKSQVIYLRLPLFARQSLHIQPRNTKRPRFDYL